MKPKTLRLIIYCLFTLYFCFLMYQVFQVSSILTKTKTIPQAMDLLENDAYPIFRLASQIMADGRDFVSVADILLNSINGVISVVSVGVLIFFRREKEFWDVLLMIVIPKLLYLFLLIPVGFGIMNQSVNATFINVNFMAMVLMALSLIIILIYLSKMVNLIVVSLK